MRALVIVLALCGGTARAGNRGGGMIIPPAEVDIGVLDPADGSALAAPTMEVLAGMHWASLFWKPTHFDVGIGYVGSFRTLAVDHPLVIEHTRTITDDQLHLNGIYLELARTLVNDKHTRTWLSARGELMKASGPVPDRSVSGAALRIQTEVYTAGTAGLGGHGRGVIAGVAGALALGVYVEASYRDLPAQYGNAGIATGVTMRVPFMIALVN